MKTKVVTFSAMLLGMMWLTGCWNSRDLKELAIVMAMGVDQVPNTKQYRASFQIVNAGEITGGTQGGGGKAQPVTIYTGTGNTIFEAIRKTSQKVPRQLFFSHIRLIVIGETLAKEGIQDLFDFFERSHEARLTSIVLVARENTAESVISTITPLEKIPANSVSGKLRFTEKVWSENIKLQIDDVIKALVSEGREPIISGVRMVGDPREGINKSNNEQTKPSAFVEIKGIALFREGKLKSWFTGREARGLVWIQDKMKSTVLDLDCKEKKKAIGIEIIRSKTKVKAEIQEGKPTFHILIREEGNVGEVKCAIDLTNPEEIKKLEAELEKETKKEVMAAVKLAQREKSDVFGFGEAVNREDPKAWEKMKKEWANTFSESKVDVKVKSYIRRPGMRTKPYLSEKKK